MNTAVAIAGIASRTFIWIAGIGAFVKVSPHFLPRLQISTPRGQAPKKDPEPAAGPDVKAEAGT